MKSSPPPTRKASRRVRLSGFSATAVANLALGIAIAAGALSPAGFFRDRARLAPSAEVRLKLRVLVRAESMSLLPRTADPVMIDRAVATELAESLGRDVDFIRESDPSRLIPRLLAGEADLIAASLTVTPERRQEVAFSTPYVYVDELLVQRRDIPAPRNAAELAGRIVSVRAFSSHAVTLEEIRAKVADLRVDLLPETSKVEDVLARVDRGDLDATVVDSHVWDALAGSFPSLRPALTLARERPIALAMRPDDDDLRLAVNEFLFSRAFLGTRDPTRTDDFDAIVSRGRLRLLTRNDAVCYFLHRGVELGFEYEMLRRFADARGLRLEVVVPPRPADLVPWLVAGRGDVVAALMPISPIHGEDVLFTRPYETAHQVVVVREEDGDVDGPEDLAGRTVAARPGSSHLEALKSLQRSFPGIRIAITPANLETEEVLACVEDGIWDAALCNSTNLQVERTYGRRLRSAFELGDEDLGWIVRTTNPRLHQALNDFLSGESRSATTNALRRRYFRSASAVARAKSAWRPDQSGRVSPYDDFAKKHAARYELDWRLLVAMMQEESGFDATGESEMGAVGLMQLLPSTAAGLGVADPRDPESSIAGGAKYLRKLLDRTDPKLPLATRVRFALASYNIGIAHVLDAKRLAGKLGWRTDRWFGNVERAMLLLEKPEYSAEARYGYCRGSECVDYVRDVEERYRTFLERVPGAAWLGPEEDAPSPDTMANGANTPR